MRSEPGARHDVHETHHEIHDDGAYHAPHMSGTGKNWKRGNALAAGAAMCLVPTFAIVGSIFYQQIKGGFWFKPKKSRA